MVSRQSPEHCASQIHFHPVLRISQECRFDFVAEDTLFRDTKKLLRMSAPASGPSLISTRCFLLPEPTLPQPRYGSVHICPQAQKINATHGRWDSWVASKKLKLQS